MKKVLPFYIIVLLLQGMFALASCDKDNYKNMTSIPVPGPVPPNTDTGKKYLALGDSYTIGQSVDVQARFPAQTVAILRNSNITIKDPEYIATTGWTTMNLMNAITSQNPKGPYDAVSLLIGVNDQYQRMDTAGYRRRFTDLLLKSIELAGNRPARVFVLSIPDYSATPFVAESDKARVRKEIDDFNNINKEITLRNNITYIDITPGSREASTNTALVANDGLHPSGLEYKKWAEKLAVEMKRVLQ